MHSMRSFRLSKSRITAGLQCGRRLWLAVHRPEREVYSADTGRRFSVGDDVGEIARQLFGPGTLIGDARLSTALRDTATCLTAAGDLTLFEAAFRHRGVLVRSDVLDRHHGVWKMVEVKSATRVKEHHLQDVAIQAWVTEGAGVPLDQISVAVVDTAFVYPGGRDYRGLLREIPVADQVRPLMARVPGWVRGLNELLGGPQPTVRMGPQCHRPFDCPFLATCREQEAGEPEIPPGLDPAGSTSGPVDRVGGADGTVDAAAETYLRGLPYPRFYLDFETVQFAIPPWAGTSPYQHLVFQWSCHVEERPGELSQREFLDISGGAPMRAAAEALIAALDSRGPIFVYHDAEKWRLVEMARMYPDLAPALERITGRLVDLLRLTRDHYHHPALAGSYSLKTVLPTIDPALDHAILEEVSDGPSAQAAYHEASMASTHEERRRRLRGHLQAYCTRDTLGLVRIVHRLSNA